MSLAKILEDLAVKIGSDPDFLKAMENSQDRKVADLAYNAIVDTMKDLFIAADHVRNLEKENIIDTTGYEPKLIDAGGLDLIASLASTYDQSGDPELVKIASVLDELLYTVAVPKGSKDKIKLADEAEVNRLREKYRGEALETAYGQSKLESEKENKTDEAVKAIDDRVKSYKPLEHALSTRQSPDMPGIQMIRIGDNVWQCPVTKKIYNYNEGFTLLTGDKVPGGSVSNQTQQLGDQLEQHSNFSTRTEILNNS